MGFTKINVVDLLSKLKSSSRNWNMSTLCGANCKSYSVLSLTVGSDTLSSLRGGVSSIRRYKCQMNELQFSWGRYAQRTNLWGRTSSRRQLRTKAYTALILSDDWKTFSSMVRFANFTRIVACNSSYQVWLIHIVWRTHFWPLLASLAFFLVSQFFSEQGSLAQCSRSSGQCCLNSS